MFDIQDEVIPTRNYRRVVLKKDIKDTYRRCGARGDLNRCPKLVPEAHKERHDAVIKILHLEIKRE